MSETLGLLKIIDGLRKPMTIKGEVEFCVAIAGDWYSVIRLGDQCEEWNDRLMRQMPHDEDDAEFRVYHLWTNDNAELLRIMNAVDAAKLRWSMECRIKGKEGDAWATTRCHYAHKPDGYIKVKAREVSS